MAQKILLVEDEESLLDVIRLNLELEGYKVTSSTNGLLALHELKNNHFDLVILDVMLPEVDGFTICQTIRLEDTITPVLFLTAKNSSEDRVFGLKIGADDYLTKPFNLEELLLRVQLLLKRSQGYSIPDIAFIGKAKANFRTYELVDHTGEKHKLTKRELLLLKLLFRKKNEVVSRDEILESIWGYDVFPSTRTIDNYILTLRKLIEENPGEPKFIHSVRGVGYKLSI